VSGLKHITQKASDQKNLIDECKSLTVLSKIENNNPGIIMKREEVYQLVDKFRETITTQMRDPGYKPGIAEEFISIDTLLRRAKDSLTDLDSPDRALTYLQLLTAFSIRCLENHIRKS
jgi:hypothetical protein